MSSVSHQLVVPCDDAIESHVSPVLMLYVEPVHVVEAADEFVEVAAAFDVVLPEVSVP